MKRHQRGFLSLAMALTTYFFFLGCAGLAHQNRQEFVSGIKGGGGPFTGSAQFSAARPLASVVATTREYSEKCLRAQTFHRADRKEAGGTTTYFPQIEKDKSGYFALSIQEKYNDRHEPGTPTNGRYTFVANMKQNGSGASLIEFYYITGRSRIGDSLKEWVQNGKRECPDLQ